MNFEPLYELKNRLENVAIVGINLAKDDFRLKRAVEQVKEYSTAAKVFKQIYVNTDLGDIFQPVGIGFFSAFIKASISS